MKNHILYSLSLMFLISCEPDEITSPIDENSSIQEIGNLFNEPTSILSDSDTLELGEKLKNPYSVANMQQSLNNLRTSRWLTLSEFLNLSRLQITTTHYYVRFLPANEEQYDVLVMNDSLDISHYPIDVEILNEGTYFHDPEVANNPYSWLYTYVPVNYQFSSNIQYEILENLYLPHVVKTTISSDLISIVDKLENQTLFDTKEILHWRNIIF